MIGTFSAFFKIWSMDILETMLGYGLHFFSILSSKTWEYAPAMETT